jgi:hypothetical protein
MFNTLYRCPRTIARHENGPLHESRRCYLEHLAPQGATLHTITAAAGAIYRAAIWMNLGESGPVECKDVERAAKRWAHRSYRNASSRGPEQTDNELMLRRLYSWNQIAHALEERSRSRPLQLKKWDAVL